MEKQHLGFTFSGPDRDLYGLFTGALSDSIDEANLSFRSSARESILSCPALLASYYRSGKPGFNTACRPCQRTMANSRPCRLNTTSGPCQLTTACRPCRLTTPDHDFRAVSLGVASGLGLPHFPRARMHQIDDVVRPNTAHRLRTTCLIVNMGSKGWRGPKSASDWKGWETNISKACERRPVQGGMGT